MVKWIIENFKEFSFYMGEKCDTEATIVLSYYKSLDDDSPTFVYFMDGLKGRLF